MTTGVRPVHEGDTILLSCVDKDVSGFVYVLPPCSDYTCAVIKSEKERPNVHAISFQVLPEYAQPDLSTSPLSIMKEEDRHYLHRKLVYGRKIKLLHVASKKYLSIPDKALKETETEPGFLSDEPYLFKMLPPPSLMNSSKGQDIFPGDEVILETVGRKGHHVLCAKNSLTDCFELKMAITNSIFSIKLQTKSDESLPNLIRGGSIVRFYNAKTDSYLCAKGSTVHTILPAVDFEHDNEQKVYFKKKRVLPVPRPPPVSGDCWWQLVKREEPYDGSSIELGGKYLLRHLPTHMYLMAGDDLKLTIGSIDDVDPKYYTFTLTSSVAAADKSVLKGSNVTLIHKGIDDKKRYLHVDDGDPTWLTKISTKRALGSKGLKVRPDVVHWHYYVESVKDVLMRYFPKLQGIHSDPVLVELVAVLKKLVRWLKDESPYNLKTCGKMLRNAHVIDLLVGYISIAVESRDEERVKLLRGVSEVLRQFLLIKSRHSHFYMAKEAFMKIYFNKLGLGLGVESFLIALVKDESEIAKYLVEFYFQILRDPTSSLKIHLDTASLELLSTLCFVDGHPEEALQDLICEEVIMKDLGDFYHTRVDKGTNIIYYSKSQLASTDDKPLTELCSNEDNNNEDLNFFVAQIFLFSNVCKGVNVSAIKTVSSWFPFQEALVVLDKEKLGGAIHSKVKSAYLQLVLAVYLDEVIHNSGVDIDGIWHCFLWERLVSDSPDEPQPLHGANIKPNLLDKDDMSYKNEVVNLLKILEEEITQEVGKISQKQKKVNQEGNHEYLHEILAVMELMSLYGYCWNVGEAKKYISIESVVSILEIEPADGESKATEYDLKKRAINILNVFFKQYIYLSLERLMYDFRYRKDHTSNNSYLKPMIGGPVNEDTLKSSPRFQEVVTTGQAPQTRYSTCILQLVVTDNPKISHLLTEHDLELIYTLASRIMVGDVAVHEDVEGPGYLEFLTTLEAVIKPCKSSGVPIKFHQRHIMKLFCANYVDHFGKILMKDKETDEEKSFELRLRVLRDDLVGFELLKLLHVTSLLGSCCDGQIKTVEVVCREIFTLDELVNILIDDKILPVRKIPFARLLVSSYLSTEKESTESLHLLSRKHKFWSHVYQVSADISKIKIEEDDEDATRCYMRKFFAYYETWEEVFNPRGPEQGLGLDEDEGPDEDEIIRDDLKKTLFLLRYFVEGLGPVVKSFCTQLASYKGKELTDKVYENMISEKLDHIGRSIENTLEELRPGLVSIVNKNKDVFITSKAQFNYWTSIVEAIDGVYLKSKDYEEQLPTVVKLVSEDIKDYKSENELQLKIMTEFYCFVSNYRFVYEWEEPSKIEPPEDLRSSDGLIPKGRSFHQLINLFSKDANILSPEGSRVSAAGGMATAARRAIGADHHVVPLVCDDTPLSKLLSVLDSQLRQQLGSKERARLHFTLLTTLQVLFGITFDKIEEIDNEEWVADSTCDKGHHSYVKNLQNKFVIEKKYPHLVLKYISNPDVKICVQIMGFLYTLVFNGNEETQDYICDRIANNANFFLSIYKLISVILQYSHIPKDFLSREPEVSIRNRNNKEDTDYGTMQQTPGGDTVVSIEEDPNVPPITNTTSFITTYPKSADELDLWLHQVGVCLDLISSLCDGQNRKLQAIMKEQDNSFNINVISGTAALLETLAEIKQENETESAMITETMTKAIQCLIELCAGNYSNQSAALDGQVLDSINLIIRESCPTEDPTTKIPIIVKVPLPIDVLEMQCKAVELLEVLLEETDKEFSPGLVKAISKDLKKMRLMYFVKAVHARLCANDKDIDEKKRFEFIERNMFRAYHILRSLAENSELEFEEFIGLKKLKPLLEEPVHVANQNRSPVANDDLDQTLEDIDHSKELTEIRTLCDELDKDTHRIEVNYITKDKKWILTPVYFPFKYSRCMSDGEKSILQANINRDSVEDKAKDLSNWTKSFLKKHEYKRELEKHHIWRVVSFLSEFDPNVTVSGLLLVPRPWNCWSTYQYIILYFFGVIHFVLSFWMVVEYFVCEKPNFLYEVPIFKTVVNGIKNCIRNDIPLLSKKFKWIDTIEESKDSECFDIYLFSFSPIYRVLFLFFSLLSIGTFGYFYCLCLPYIFLNIDVMQDIVKAISRRRKQLFLMACFILSLLLIYAVLSFAIMSSFFDPGENNQFCTTLWQCYITVIREGLLDGFGAISVTYVGQNGANFKIYLWRAVFDLIFFVVISTISLEVITAILVDTFSELRQEKDTAEKDQKSVCFVCGIDNDDFERRGKGFAKHYHSDHNIYSYIYFILHIKSMSPHDHNAIEKYVSDKFGNDEIEFYPLHKAKVLGGLVLKKKDMKGMIDEMLVNT
uniref:RyR/IP3R Homology associated domain-containing protein n=2 Tax=Amphimedon queenslandica TaxID=400682 RepID=A0A1X7UPY7_AMPQE